MMPVKSENDLLKQVESQIGYQFKNRSLLLEAITHRSFARDERLKNDNVVSQNERLEFLGDAILSMVSALELYTSSPRANEGMLTQLRANYVCEPHLALGAKNAGLGALIRVSSSMRKPHGVDLPSLLCDVVEALIGAVYLDAGFEDARALVLRLLGPVPTKVTVAPKDAKTELQEWSQEHVGLTPLYKVAESKGPAHSPVFTVEVYVEGRKLAEGSGKSKKDAAQEAAKAALKQLK
jgi:ribonuclease-3